MVGNTHPEASETGVTMTHAYHEAQHIIKKHVNAGSDDVLISEGSGMTGAISKFQRILGLKIPEQARNYCYPMEATKKPCPQLADNDRPVVFVTHMEHHSNQTSWLETIAEVVVLEPDDKMRVCPDSLRKVIGKYKSRTLKIGSFSACSNVTGLQPDYYELAKIMHENDGYCFVDFAASAPYLKIDMHPENDPKACLDAIFLAPHKFLGGPGSAGILIFNKELYKNEVPDNPGGGTVEWTDRWGNKRYINDIETREDGGTPAFLQTIRVALSVKLKEEMGMDNIKEREEELIKIAFAGLRKVKGLHILMDHIEDRIGVFSFYMDHIHHNLMVKLLNDRFGVQVRGGCSCAGTYGHYLLDVTKELSSRITEQINQGDASNKPGWVRMSIHPTMTDADLRFVIDAISQVADNIDEWQKDYYHDKTNNEWFHKDAKRLEPSDFASWFEFKA